MKFIESRMNRRRLHVQGETLEPRRVLAADPIITEFVASNESTRDDNDRQSSDWIEIFNQGDDEIEVRVMLPDEVRYRLSSLDSVNLFLP